MTEQLESGRQTSPAAEFLRRSRIQQGINRFIIDNGGDFTGMGDPTAFAMLLAERTGNTHEILGILAVISDPDTRPDEGTEL